MRFKFPGRGLLGRSHAHLLRDRLRLLSRHGTVESLPPGPRGVTATDGTNTVPPILVFVPWSPASPCDDFQSKKVMKRNEVTGVPPGPEGFVSLEGEPRSLSLSDLRTQPGDGRPQTRQSPHPRGHSPADARPRTGRPPALSWRGRRPAPPNPCYLPSTTSVGGPHTPASPAALRSSASRFGGRDGCRFLLPTGWVTTCVSLPPGRRRADVRALSQPLCAASRFSGWWGVTGPSTDAPVGCGGVCVWSPAVEGTG